MAVDVTKFSTHVQAAIVAIDLPLHALKRVQEGVAWLESNAPLDWRLQMISIYGGKVVSHVRLCRNDENPLALAFRRVQAFQDPSGRVTWAELMNPPIIPEYEAQKCGFLEMEHRATDNVYIDKNIDGMFLDDAWATVLGEYKAGFQPVKSYPQQIEEVYVLRRAVCGLPLLRKSIGRLAFTAA